MKIFKINVIYPGMYSIHEEIRADFFESFEGSYRFYIGSSLLDKKLICAYPVMFTIIESIKEIEK